MNTAVIRPSSYTTQTLKKTSKGPSSRLRYYDLLTEIKLENLNKITKINIENAKIKKACTSRFYKGIANDDCIALRTDTPLESGIA